MRRAQMRQHDIVEALACGRRGVGCHSATVREAPRNGHRQRPHITRTTPVRGIFLAQSVFSTAMFFRSP
jgi:hypothetical protein